jgi:hypothetical protein
MELRPIRVHRNTDGPRDISRIVQQCNKFPKIYEPPSDLRWPKDDKMQISYWGPSNIRCHRTKYSHHGDLSPVFSPSLLVVYFLGFRYIIIMFSWHTLHLKKTDIKQKFILCNFLGFALKRQKKLTVHCVTTCKTIIWIMHVFRGWT